MLQMSETRGAGGWGERGVFLLQQIGVSPEEKLSQVDNLQISFQARKGTRNQVIFFLKSQAWCLVHVKMADRE